MKEFGSTEPFDMGKFDSWNQEEVPRTPWTIHPNES